MQNNYIASGDQSLFDTANEKFERNDMAWNAYCKTCGELRQLNDSGECTNCQINNEKMLHNLREFSVDQETIIKYMKQESDKEEE